MSISSGFLLVCIFISFPPLLRFYHVASYLAPVFDRHATSDMLFTSTLDASWRSDWAQGDGWAGCIKVTVYRQKFSILHTLLSSLCCLPVTGSFSLECRADFSPRSLTQTPKLNWPVTGRAVKIVSRALLRVLSMRLNHPSRHWDYPWNVLGRVAGRLCWTFCPVHKDISHRLRNLTHEKRDKKGRETMAWSKEILTNKKSMLWEQTPPQQTRVE